MVTNVFRLILVFSIATAATGGCDSGADLNQAAAPLQSNRHIVFHGQNFTWRRSVPAPYRGVVPSAKSQRQDVTPRFDPAAEAAYQATLDSLSNADYAENLRPVLLVGDNEYIGDSVPSGAEVSAIRANLTSHRGEPVSPLEAVTVTQSPLVAGIEVKKSALYTDLRQHLVNTAWPQTTQIYLRTECSPPDGPTFNCFSECSATLIGPNTALAAAHCFYDRVSQTWKSFRYGATGHDPYIPSTVATFGCFSIAFPSAWETSSGTPNQYDFAVLDFTGCGDNPAPASGYLGYWQNINLGGGKVWAAGYAPGLHCFSEQPCGMSGTASSSGSFWNSGNVYVSGGQSGTSLYYEDATHNFYSIGDVVATSTTLSYSRKMDNLMYSYFHTYSDPVRFP